MIDILNKTPYPQRLCSNRWSMFTHVLCRQCHPPQQPRWVSTYSPSSGGGGNENFKMTIACDFDEIVKFLFRPGYRTFVKNIVYTFGVGEALCNEIV